MPEITMEEIKNDIAKFLERIFVERRVAKDLDLDVEEIDQFIKDEGARQLEKFESMTSNDMIDFMLGEIKGFIEHA